MTHSLKTVNVLHPHVSSGGLGEGEQLFQALVTLVKVSHLCV